MIMLIVLKYLLFSVKILLNPSFPVFVVVFKDVLRVIQKQEVCQLFITREPRELPQISRTPKTLAKKIQVRATGCELLANAKIRNIINSIVSNLLLPIIYDQDILKSN